MTQTVFDLLFVQFLVSDREWIDRRLKEELLRLDLLLVFFNAENHCVVLLYEPEQILPQLFVRIRQIYMATPDPRASGLVMGNHRQRLWVVDDDEVVTIQIVSDRVLVHYIFVDAHLQLTEIQFFSLKRVVHLLGYAEEVGRTLNRPPSRLDSHTAHQQSERIQQLGYASAVVGGVHVRNMNAFERLSLLANALDGSLADQRRVVFDTIQLLMSGRTFHWSLRNCCRFSAARPIARARASFARLCANTVLM